MTFFTESSDEKIFSFSSLNGVLRYSTTQSHLLINRMTYFGWIAKDRSDIFPIGPPGSQFWDTGDSIDHKDV